MHKNYLGFLKKSNSTSIPIGKYLKIINFDSYIEDDKFFCAFERIHNYRSKTIEDNNDLNTDIKVAFCGEIFNYQDLFNLANIPKEKTPNVSIHNLITALYHIHGLDFLEYIDGFFSIVLWDKKNDFLVFAVDRFGTAKLAYYSILPDMIIFSNKLTNLIKTPNLNKDIDFGSLALFLKYSYTPAPGTIFKNVKKLCPGELIVFQKGIIKRERYLKFTINNTLFSDEQSAVQKYNELLCNSIEKKLSDYRNQKIGIFLSGGLDSSANVALAVRTGFKDITAFGVGFNDPTIDERPYARIAAKHFNIRYEDYVFTGNEIEALPKILHFTEEPFLENGLFLTYAGFMAAQNKVDIIIAGDGCDQLFGTGGFAGGRPIALRYIIDKLYLRNLTSMLRIIMDRRCNKDNLLYKIRVMTDRAVDFNDWFFWGYNDYEIKQLLGSKITKDNLRIFSNKINSFHSAFFDYYNSSLISQDLEHYLCQNVLFKSSRMAEMFGIKLRETYIDNDIVNFLLSITVHLKRKGNLINYLIGNTTSKYLHRLAMQNILPKKIMEKPKQGGFIPTSLLLGNEERRKKILRYILNAKIIKDTMNSDFIISLIQDYEALTSKKIFWHGYYDAQTNKILYLLTFAIWYELFMNNNFNDSTNITLSDIIG